MKAYPDYRVQEQAAGWERYDHTLTCPACKETVKTIPAEAVPDQTLRGCPKCGEVFWQDLES